ncbi:hypothetical protein [Sorangium sp. So ce1097]|uniref:hypothetical protein n=1 Tax=Sorangium sp. So ce1097 TaxID=3133330 RepID=UPI003F5FCF52
MNQAMRCLRGLAAAFFERVQAHNSGVPCEIVEVSPRDTNAPIPTDCDLYLASGGPGSPFDGEGEPWMLDFGRFVDGVVESAIRGGADRRALFAICYSFELIVHHYRLADVVPRAERKFGVMPIYTTALGQHHPLLAPFGDRLFAFEHRNWEAVNLDERRLGSLGGQLLARESRDGVSKGRAILGLDVAPGVEAVQFHPEADRAGVMNWVARPEQAAAFKAAYGEVTYQAMLRTLDDPRRLARTYALVIPGWLGRCFNEIAGPRGYAALPPIEDVPCSHFDAHCRAEELAAASGRPPGSGQQVARGP